MPRPLSPEEISTGLFCRRQLYHLYHHLLSDAARETRALEERFARQQLQIAREAYHRSKGVEGEVPSAVVLENSFLRVSVDVLLDSPDECRIVVISTATAPKRSAMMRTAIALLILDSTDSEEKPTRVRLVHLNRNYIHGEESQPLFCDEEVTAGARALADSLRERVPNLVTYLARDSREVEDDRRLCPKPDRCPACSRELEAEGPDHVFSLFRGRDKALSLYQQGISRLVDIPPECDLGRRQRIQVDCHRSDVVHIDAERVGEFLGALSYPLGFLDFEAVQEAIPSEPLSRPWQHLPFLFSLHSVDHNIAEETDPRHCSYLCREGLDSLGSMAQILASAVAGLGSIIVYNREMEARSLSYLAERFPEFADTLEAARDRLVDLYLLFQAYSVYHPRQHGSLSLKSVIPALTDVAYEGGRYRDGRSASLAYHDAHVRPSRDLSEGEGEEIDDELVRYCTLDTLGLVKVVEVLSWMVGDGGASRIGPVQKRGPADVSRAIS